MAMVAVTVQRRSGKLRARPGPSQRGGGGRAVSYVYEIAFYLCVRRRQRPPSRQRAQPVAQQQGDACCGRAARRWRVTLLQRWAKGRVSAGRGERARERSQPIEATTIRPNSHYHRSHTRSAADTTRAPRPAQA
eukprot:349737-Chlamydomonas_euryale.AAC.6